MTSALHVDSGTPLRLLSIYPQLSWGGGGRGEFFPRNPLFLSWLFLMFNATISLVSFSLSGFVVVPTLINPFFFSCFPEVLINYHHHCFEHFSRARFKTFFLFLDERLILLFAPPHVCVLGRCAKIRLRLHAREIGFF